MVITEIIAAACIFASSYITVFAGTHEKYEGFVVVYAMMFGLLVGCQFLIPLIEMNKYFPGKRMHINGFILIGTGLGSVIFSQFSSLYINPDRKPSNAGYYDGKLTYITEAVPSSIRWLSLMYLLIGMTGIFLQFPVYLANERARKIEQ